MKKIKNKNKKKNLIGNIVIGILLFISIFLIGTIIKMDFMPFKYLIIVILILGIIDFALVWCIKKGKKIVRIITMIISLIISIVLSFISFNILKTNSILGNMNLNYKTHNYSVLVLKDSGYSDISELDGEKLGYYDNKLDEPKEILSKIEEKISVDSVLYNDLDETVDALMNKEVEMIVLEESYIKMLDEESNFSSLVKSIYNFKIKIEVKDVSKDIDVTNEPFNIYLSGIDTFGEVSSVSRSDVNIVITVNPKTHQVLLTSTPRDTYVQLSGTTGYKDKLTHAGIYGVEKSISTIEELLDIEINYYFKVNFTSVIDIVDTLGGVNVYSEYSFTSMDGYNYKKGYNYVNGEQALSFVRERKAFSLGDVQRGKNQQAMIEALIRKCISPDIISKYSSLLDSVNGKFATNMPISRMMNLIKMQLEGNYEWTVTSNYISGTDGSEYTYSYPTQKLYVMIPDDDSILNAKELIDKVEAGKILDGSYGEEQSGSYVTQSPVTNNNSNNESSNDDKVEAEQKEENNKEEETNDDPLEDLLPSEDDKIPDDGTGNTEDNTGGNNTDTEDKPTDGDKPVDENTPNKDKEENNVKE